jgi:Lar family restriction alleviation protein
VASTVLLGYSAGGFFAVRNRFTNGEQITMKPLPCPFCGSSDVEFYIRRSIHRLFCGDCSAAGPVALGVQEAITLWNTRTGTVFASVHAEILERLNLLEQMMCKDDAKDEIEINTHLRNVWWFRDSINEYFASRSAPSSATPPVAPCPPPSEAPEA